MKSTKYIKDKLNEINVRIDKLEVEMQEKNIEYESSRDHFKYPPQGEYSIGTTYKEYLGELTAVKRLLEEILKP